MRMQNWLKASGVVLALGAAPIVYAKPAVRQAVQQLNQVLREALAPLQNEQTRATIRFREIINSDIRTEAVSLKAEYSKKGPANALALRINDLSYEYGTGENPTTTFDLRIDLDLVKLLTQEKVNELGPVVDGVAKGFAKDYIEKYGKAITVKARAYDLVKDANGDLESVRLLLAGKLDLDKLPGGLPKDQELFKEASVEAAFDRGGVGIRVTLVANPEYAGFKADEKGMKEALDQLLARDPKAIAEIQGIFAIVDSVAEKFVNGRQD